MHAGVKVGFLPVFIFLISACQPFIRTHITTYHDDTATPIKGSIRIQPPESFEGSDLEFSFYKRKLAKKFTQMGLVASDEANTPLVAVLAYGVTRQEKDASNAKLLMGSHYGFGRRAGTTLIIANDDSDEFENVRHLSLSIRQKENAEGKEVNEIINITAQSVGSCKHLNVVVDQMLDAIFQEFYRPDGSIKKVKVKGGARCP